MRMLTLAFFLLASGACGDDDDSPDPGPDAAVDGADGSSSDVREAGDAADGDARLPDPTSCPRARIAAGISMTCSIDCEGHLLCWGAIRNRPADRGYTLVPTARDIGPAGATWVDLSALSYAMCGVTEGGELWCWGDLRQTGVAAGNFTDPVRIGTDADWGHVAATAQGNTIGLCAIKRDGRLFCWSDDAPGTAVAMVAAERFVDVDIGNRFACAVAESGSAWCWGANESGQLGQGAGGEPSDEPLEVDGDFTHVETSAATACALGRDGDVTCWGEDRTLAGTESRAPTAVAAGHHFRSIDLDGQLLSGVDDAGVLRASRHVFYFQEPIAPFDPIDPRPIWVDATFGDTQVCAIDGDGIAHCMGGNQWGESGLGRAATRWTPERIEGTFTAVAAGFNTSCAIGGEGNASCWGSFIGATRDLVQSPLEKPAPELVAKIATHVRARCAIGRSGALYCQGDTRLSGATADWVRVGSDSDWTEIVINGDRFCGLRAGRPFCWDSTGTIEAADAASDWLELATDTSEDMVCAIKTGGTLWCSDRGDPFVRVGTIAGLHGVFVTSRQGCALDEGGVARCGGPGDVTLDSPSDSSWRLLRGGGPGQARYCGIHQAGDLECFGGYSLPSEPVIGTGNPEGSTLAPLSDTDWIDLATSGTHTCALKGDGALYCWGDGANGQLGFGDAFVTAMSPVAVAP